jgi:hypothetical protein
MQTVDSGEDASDEVPKEVVAQAKAAFGQRIQGELAVLAWDSLVDEGAPVADHQLRFDHPRVRIEVRVAVSPAGSRLSGKVDGPAPARVELHSEQLEVPLPADVSGGVFTIEGVPPGVVRLELAFGGPGGAVTIHTDWFRI